MWKQEEGTRRGLKRKNQNAQRATHVRSVHYYRTLLEKNSSSASERGNKVVPSAQRGVITVVKTLRSPSMTQSPPNHVAANESLADTPSIPELT